MREDRYAHAVLPRRVDSPHDGLAVVGEDFDHRLVDKHPQHERPAGPELEGASLEDRWMFSRLARCAEQTNKSIGNYRYHETAQTLWHFFWHEFCDWYVELKKLRRGICNMQGYAYVDGKLTAEAELSSVIVER